MSKTTTEEGMKKWINNQHSDARFGGVPQHLVTKELPTGFCEVTSRRQTGTGENPGPAKGMFEDFEVAVAQRCDGIVS